MTFRFISIAHLPPLAWCARLRKEDPLVTVFHGSDVEIRPDAFVEGAWDDDFTRFHFLESTVMSGTGGRAEKDCVRFTGSTDRLNQLFSVDTDSCLYISNSLIFVLSTSGEEPDPIYPYYSYDLVRLWRQGLHCLEGCLPLRSGKKVGLHFGAILRVNQHGTRTLERHDPGVVPADYGHYKFLLEERVKKVLANAQAATRLHPYRPLATLSRGYDSSVTAILARAGGCREVVTLLDSREPDAHLDSGLANARRLGMDCHEVDRWSYTKRDASTIAALTMYGISCDTPVAGFEDQLKGRIFVAGYFGDTIWDPHKSAVCDELSQTWARFASGISKVEFRLRVGFLSLAPATILARHHRAIHDITQTASMRPWHVGGDYNRPIARRIIEEAGLPRDSFATFKRGGGHAHFRPKKRDVSPAMESYRDFVRRLHAEVPTWRRAFWQTRVRTSHFLWRHLGARQKRIVCSSPLQRRFPFLMNISPIHLDWPAMFTLPWAHALLAPQYRIPMEMPQPFASPALTGVTSR